MKVESKTVLCTSSQEKIYNFLSDFNNFTKLMPSAVQGWQTDGETCSFKVGGFVQLTLAYVERVPYSSIAIGPQNGSDSPLAFTARVVLDPCGANETKAHIVVDVAGGNPMMTMMLKPKLRDAVDKLAEKLQYFASAL